MSYTPGRFIMSTTDDLGARDMPNLTHQVAHIRKRLVSAGHPKVGLLLVVVSEPEYEEAAQLVKSALERQILVRDSRTQERQSE